MIPVSMIDRIEVVTGGAAAIYGADAVTGAVNVITKRDIEGLHISGLTGISEQGDAAKYLISAATGGKFADGRGTFSIGGAYSQSNPLIYTDRFRSEEHTSELQSLMRISYAVFCLKKK